MGGIQTLLIVTKIDLPEGTINFPLYTLLVRMGDIAGNLLLTSSFRNENSSLYYIGTAFVEFMLLVVGTKISRNYPENFPKIYC
jgi:hypothetical protein